MAEEGFDMFDDDDPMDEADETQKPENSGSDDVDVERSTDNDEESPEEEEEEEEEQTNIERCAKLLGDYNDSSIVGIVEEFWDTEIITTTGRGKRNAERGSSGFVASTTGDKLIKRAGIARSDAASKQVVARLVDEGAQALISRAVISMALNKRVTIKEEDIYVATELTGRQLV